MKKLDDILDIAKKVLKVEANAILALIEKLDAGFERVSNA